MPLGQFDDLDITANFDILSAQGGKEDELILPIRLGIIDYILQGNPPVQSIHEHIEFIKNPEGWGHGIPKCEDERHT